MEFISEQKNLFDFDYDFLPTNEDMVNNTENILNCIHSTNDINLILLHRSLYIIQKKFEQNKQQLKSLYEKYGEYLNNDENLLINQNYLYIIMNEIFNIIKLEISDVASFKEALFKEMEYCKEINIEQYIFNEFLDFIRNNRKKYNFIFREKRNNSQFNFDNYSYFSKNIKDDWIKEEKISIFEDEQEESEINIMMKNIQKNKIPSSKYRNNFDELNKKSKDNLKINLESIKENKDSFYQISKEDNNINNSNENNDNSKSKIDITERSNQNNINAKAKNEENQNDDEVKENIDDENKEKNKSKDSNKQELNNDEKEKTEESEEGEEGEENEDEENNEIEDSNDINEDNEVNKSNNIKIETNDKDIKVDNAKLLFSNRNKKKEIILEKKYYKTEYNKQNGNNIKSIKYNKYFIYADIIPLIIADFISDQKNLYLVIDHSDDLRADLTSIFDVEILYKLGENNFEEILSHILSKISEYKKIRLKIEKNIENYEKIMIKKKNKNEDITYIDITLKKLNDFYHWLSSKIFHMQNDIKKFNEFEKNKKIEYEKIFGVNHKKFNKDKLKEKKEKIIDEYKQLKMDLEIRKFMVRKKKSKNNISNKIKLKPITKNNSTLLNNSNTNNISKIEKDNSNNLTINSNEIIDENKNSFMLSERNLSNKKNYKVKNINLKTNFDNILTEKIVDSDKDEEQDEKGEQNDAEENEENEEIYENIKNDDDFSNQDINKEELIESTKKESLLNNSNKEQNIEEFNDKNKIQSNEESNNKNNNQSSEESHEKNNINDLNKNNNDLDNQVQQKNNNIKIKIKPLQNQQIKKNKKIKLLLKSDNNINKNLPNNTNNINISIQPKNKNININIKDINNITKENNNNNNILSSGKLTTNPKTTKSLKRKVNYILKKIEKPNKNLSKEEKREIALKDIFDFYSTKISNTSKSFETINTKQGNLNLIGFSKFCSDFKIPLTKDKISSLFNKSISGDARIMSFHEFKLCLISLSFEINNAQIEEINRGINIFIGKVKQKNKEKSRFEKIDIKEQEKNKEIINQKVKLMETIQKKTEEELIEELFKFMEIDYPDKYKSKMKGVFNNNSNKLNLPKIPNKEIELINNRKNEHSKSNALLTFSKSEKGNPQNKKKINIGMRVWVKNMVEKVIGDTPKKEKIEYEIEETEDKEEEKDEEKKEDLPVIERKGVPLFTRNKKKDEKKYLYEKFL